MKTAHGTAGLVAMAAAMAVGLAAPREASAQVRVNGLLGIEHVGLAGPNGPAMSGTARAEVAFGFLPWIQLAGYAAALNDLGGDPTGSDFGGMIVVQPHIPTSSIDPLVFGSVGYLNYPVGNSALSGGWEGQLGAGLAFHINPWADFEARAAFVQMLSRDDTVLDGQGYSFTAGFSLHP